MIKEHYRVMETVNPATVHLEGIAVKVLEQETVMAMEMETVVGVLEEHPLEIPEEVTLQAIVTRVYHWIMARARIVEYQILQQEMMDRV
ncbi:hypothetical protein D3C71_1932850 [compost metagenome]